MNWQRPEGAKYYEKSECGTYTVCAVRLAEGWMFEAWRGKEMLATRLPSGAAAKAMCVQLNEKPENGR